MHLTCLLRLAIEMGYLITPRIISDNSYRKRPLKKNAHDELGRVKYCPACKTVKSALNSCESENE